MCVGIGAHGPLLTTIPSKLDIRFNGFIESNHQFYLEFYLIVI